MNLRNFEKSRKFEKEKICYEQNFQHMSSLNRQMNQVPALAMTLTGGLWFGAGVVENLDDVIRFGLLVFAGLCNLALVGVALRIRDVMASYLTHIKHFSPSNFASGTSEKAASRFRDRGMISIYSGLMVIGGLLSWVGALTLYWPWDSSTVECNGKSVATIVLVIVVLAWCMALFKIPWKESRKPCETH